MEYSEQHQNTSLVWRQDRTWMKPMVEMKGRDRFDDIDKWLARLGLLCRIDGGEYVFIDSANCWTNLASAEAMSRINAIIGIFNATVNIEKSLKSFLKYIVKRCNTNVGKPLPTSVCIGVERLEVDIDTEQKTITFNPCRFLLGTVSKEANPLVKAVCIMPIDTDAIPQVYKFPGTGTIIAFLTSVFPDMRKLVTVMWHIGNALVDPITRPKSLMLCGPGGSGKSNLLQVIYSALLGCCGILFDGSLTSRAIAMPEHVAEVVVGNRMAICYDVGLEAAPLNMSIFKNISGSDYLRVNFTSCKTNCSLTLATNGVVDIDKQREYLSDAILRRNVAILMNVAALEIPKTRSAIPDDAVSKIDFVGACIYTRMIYESIPITPMDFLLSLCMSKIDEVLIYVRETDEPVDIISGTAVLRVLSQILDITLKEEVQSGRNANAVACITVMTEGVALPGLTKNMASTSLPKALNTPNPFESITNWTPELLQHVRIKITTPNETTSEFTRKNNPNNRYWKALVSFSIKDRESRVIKSARALIPYVDNANYGVDFCYATLNRSIGEAIRDAAAKQDINVTLDDARVASNSEQWWMSVNGIKGRVGVIDKDGSFDPKDLAQILKTSERGVMVNMDTAFSLSLSKGETKARNPQDVFHLKVDCSRAAIKAINQDVDAPATATAIPVQRAAKEDIASEDLMAQLSSLSI
ncbi:MAG: hypothetical protein Q9187_001233 [Circinaria calcarea]